MVLYIDFITLLSCIITLLTEFLVYVLCAHKLNYMHWYAQAVHSSINL